MKAYIMTDQNIKAPYLRIKYYYFDSVVDKNGKSRFFEVLSYDVIQKPSPPLIPVTVNVSDDMSNRTFEQYKFVCRLPDGRWSMKHKDSKEYATWQFVSKKEGRQLEKDQLARGEIEFATHYYKHHSQLPPFYHVSSWSNGGTLQWFCVTPEQMPQAYVIKQEMGRGFIDSYKFQGWNQFAQTEVIIETAKSAALFTPISDGKSCYECLETELSSQLVYMSESYAKATELFIMPDNNMFIVRPYMLDLLSFVAQVAVQDPAEVQYNILGVVLDVFIALYELDTAKLIKGPIIQQPDNIVVKVSYRNDAISGCSGRIFTVGLNMLLGAVMKQVDISKLFPNHELDVAIPKCFQVALDCVRGMADAFVLGTIYLQLLLCQSLPDIQTEFSKQFKGQIYNITKLAELRYFSNSKTNHDFDWQSWIIVKLTQVGLPDHLQRFNNYEDIIMVMAQYQLEFLPDMLYKRCSENTRALIQPKMYKRKGK